MILCGGFGTRLRDVSEVLPKPMVPIGGYPILWHSMKSYASVGVDRFILCLGYKKEIFADFFLNYRARSCNFTVNLQTQNVAYEADAGTEDWEVTLADTGANAMTGCRVARATRFLRPDDDSFFLTYGDGLSNVDLESLHQFHQSHNKLSTITAVHPAGRFGEIRMEGDAVTSFEEKPQTSTGFINGGFMMLRRDFCDRYLSDDESLQLEQKPLVQASLDGELKAFRHEGFWQCMDTSREYQYLNKLWTDGNAPWKMDR